MSHAITNLTDEHSMQQSLKQQHNVLLDARDEAEEVYRDYLEEETTRETLAFGIWQNRREEPGMEVRRWERENTRLGEVAEEIQCKLIKLEDKIERMGLAWWEEPSRSAVLPAMNERSTFSHLKDV